MGVDASFAAAVELQNCHFRHNRYAVRPTVPCADHTEPVQWPDCGLEMPARTGSRRACVGAEAHPPVRDRSCTCTMTRVSSPTAACSCRTTSPRSALGTAARVARPWWCATRSSRATTHGARRACWLGALAGRVAVSRPPLREPAHWRHGSAGPTAIARAQTSRSA